MGSVGEGALMYAQQHRSDMAVMKLDPKRSVDRGRLMAMAQHGNADAKAALAQHKAMTVNPADQDADPTTPTATRSTVVLEPGID